MSDIIKKYQNNYKKISDDFFKFWYEESRFQYRPVVGYTHKKYKSEFFNINEEGFRSKKNFSEKLINKNKKIFFFGSSALAGIPNLSDDKIISQLVENNLRNKFDCYNFGLIASKINSEFSLMQQVLLENSPDIIVLFTGYNDMNAAYHGHKFEYYDDINLLLKMGFEYEKKKSSILYAIDRVTDSIINKYQLTKKKFFLKNYLTVVERLKKERRQILKKNINYPTYEFSKNIFTNYLELCFYLCNKKKIKTIYIHQPSLLTTKKDLSEYEEEFYKTHNELGLYKNSNLTDDQENFRKNYELFKRDAFKICINMGIEYIDFEDVLSKDYNKENIFYDNVHLTNEGSEILSTIISKKILNNI